MSDLTTLVSGGKLNRDDTTWLTVQFYDKATILYAITLGTAATDIGFFTMQMVPEPSTIFLLLVGAGWLWQRVPRR